MSGRIGLLLVVMLTAIVLPQQGHAVDMLDLSYMLRESGERTGKVLVVSLDFRPGIHDSDFRALRSVIERIPCATSWFRLIIVPIDPASSDSAWAAAERLGGIASPLEDASREALGILNAPSYVVLDSLLRPLDAPGSRGSVLRYIPLDLLQPTSVMRVVLVGDAKRERFIAVNENCHQVLYEIRSDTALVLPCGSYQIRLGDSVLSNATVTDALQDTSIVAVSYKKPVELAKAEVPAPTTPVVTESQPAKTSPAMPVPTGGPKITSIKPSEWDTPRQSPRRYFGPAYLGIDAGVYFVQYRSNGRDIAEGVYSLGLSARYLGVLGVYAYSFFETDSVRFEGGVAGGELTPTFLCIGNWFSLAPGAGYLWLKLRQTGPPLVRGGEDYLEPFVSASVFLGKIGRDSSKRRGRSGLLLHALYTEPKEYPFVEANEPGVPNDRIGGYMYGAYLQVEF